jgi:hypothetical protein
MKSRSRFKPFLSGIHRDPRHPFRNQVATTTVGQGGGVAQAADLPQRSSSGFAAICCCASWAAYRPTDLVGVAMGPISFRVGHQGFLQVIGLSVRLSRDKA